MIKTKFLTFSLLLIFTTGIFAQSEVEEMLSDTLEIMAGDTNNQVSADFLEEQSSLTSRLECQEASCSIRMYPLITKRLP